MDFMLRLLGSAASNEESQNNRANGYPLGQPLIAGIGLLSLGLFLLSRFGTGALSEIKIQAVFILLFLGGVFIRKWQRRSDVVVYIILFSIALPLISFAINYYFDPEKSVQDFDVGRLFVLTGFSAMGYWIGGTLKNIYIFLIIAFIGLLFSLFSVDVISAFSDVLHSKRVSFGLNPNIQAMLFGLSIIAFIAFSNNFFLFRCSKPYKFLFSVIYISFFLLSLVVFFGSQSRSTTLSLDLLLVLLIVHVMVKVYKGKAFIQSKGRLAILVGFSIIFFTASSHTMSVRGTGEEMKELSGVKLESIPMTSLGIRLNLWFESISWIKQKPLHGWGGGANKGVVQQFNLHKENNIKVFNLHNSYIEFILSYGLAGLALIFYMFYFLNRKILKLSQIKPEYNGIWYYTFYGSLFMLLNNFTDSFLFLGGGIYAMAILLAPAYTLYLSSLYKDFGSLNTAKS